MLMKSSLGPCSDSMTTSVSIPVQEVTTSPGTKFELDMVMEDVTELYVLDLCSSFELPFFLPWPCLAALAPKPLSRAH